MDSPEIRLFSRPAGSSNALVFIDGFLSAKKYRCDDLLPALNNAGWRHSVYQLWWNAESASYLNYHKCKDRAKLVGRNKFQTLIETQIPEQNICLLAHSLGARVAYEGMKSWTGKYYLLEDVILLSGSVRRDSSKDWSYVAEQIKGNLINVYSEDDFVLKTMFKSAELGNACGYKPIKQYHPRIKNEDATSFIGKHKLVNSLSYLPELVKKGLWRI